MRDVAQKLHDRAYPVRFEYGPDAVVREGRDLLVVMQRDREQGDGVGPPVGVRENPRGVRVRSLGVVARVYVRSSKPNATVWDHESLCDHVVDALFVALYEWGAEAKAGDLPVRESRYLSAAELSNDERWAGVVYQIRFQLPRGLQRVTYQGAAQPTGSASTIASRTDVHGPGGSDDTGCGG